MLFILPQVFFGAAAVPDRAATGDPHGQRPAIGGKPVAAWIRGRVHAVTKGPVEELLAVHVERRTGAAESDAAPAGEQLSALVKNTIGVTVTTVVTAPDSIERSMGKMRRIVDHRR